MKVTKEAIREYESYLEYILITRRESALEGGERKLEYLRAYGEAVQHMINFRNMFKITDEEGEKYLNELREEVSKLYREVKGE